MDGEVRWLDERELRAWRSLQRMQLQLSARLSRELAAASGLSYQDYLVLAVLTDQPDGRMRIFELVREMGWEKSRMSHHLARMVDRGLVAREPCTTDRRGAFVVITDEGRDRIEAAAPGHVATVRRFFIDRLTADQLDTIGDVAGSVLDDLAE